METFSELNIKGMVCNRCIYAIKETLIANGFLVYRVSLGKVIFSEAVDQSRKEELKGILDGLGFELISDRNEQLLVELKHAIAEWMESQESGRRNIKLSEFLSQNFNKSYDALSDFFSRHEGKTIEKYFIWQRLEKVRELLVYSDLSLSDIAFKTGFNSPFHLSSQFKNTFGFNPSTLRSINKKAIKSL